MKKLLTALATAATAALGFAEITVKEDFEDSSYTAYDNDKPSLAAPYDFEGYGDYYRSLDDDGEEELLAYGASCVDAVMQFKYADAPDEFVGDEKLVVFANSDGKLVVVDAVDTNVTTTAIAEDTWYRLTIVSVDETVNDATVKKFKVYVNGGLAGTEGGVASFTSRVANDNSVATMTLSGTGKVDNFVARTTDPFGGAPAGWIANIGTADPEQYFTDYTKALEAALAGATLTFADGETEMDGTAAHPFEIRSAADLVALQQAVATTPAARAYNYLQTADIDMSGAAAFPGIGTYNESPADGIAFTGVYDGGNHKISSVTMTARKYGGIFNQVVGGTVKNLAVENISVASGATVAYGYAIVGHAANGATLQNLTATGSFLSSETPGTHNMAGIVVRVCGGADSATVTTVANCTNNAAIYGGYTKLAGVCAIAEAQTGFTAGSVLFQNCANAGALTSSHDSTTATGLAGILAYSAANTVLDGCTNTGTLSNTSEAANTDVNGSLVGTVQNNTLTLKSAVASGDIGKFNAGCTVALDFDVSGKNVDFNLYGATGSTVELLQDFTGYPPQNAVVNPTLKLSANMTINDGWQNITNATFTAISGAGTLTASHTYDYVKYYRIKKLDGFTGTLASGQPRVYFVIDDIVAAETPAYGAAVVKGGSSLKVYDLASTTLGGVAADLCVDTLDNQNGIYLVAAQVVADDNSTTGYASVANALDAADAANASSVNVLDANAEVVEATDWSYENGVYTSTREVATLNDTSYPSLAKALAAAQDGDTVTLVAASPEAVTIPAGVTVAVTDNVAFNGTVAGAGTVKYTAAQTGTIKFGEWTGTVTLDWAGIVNANDIAAVVSKYGKEGSTVEIGPNGTITGDSYFNSNPVVTLKVSGFVSINNGSTNTERTLPTVTGDGVLVFGSSGGRVNYRITNLVEWDGVVTNSSAAVGIANVTSGSGKIVFVSTPDIAPTIGEGFTGEVYLNFNYSNYNIALYGGVNATRYLGTMSGHLHDGAGETEQTGEIPGKTVVADNVTINNGYTIGSADWAAAKVVKFDSLKVDGSLTLDSTSAQFGTARCYYYVRSLDAAGVGTITVGDGFGLRIDAVDFAEEPSDSDVALVRLTLEKADLLTTDGQLFGTGGKWDGRIAVTVNGEATEQTLVYDADKGGLVLYVEPVVTYVATDSKGNNYTSVEDALRYVYTMGKAGDYVTVLDETYEDKGLYADYFTWDATARTYTLRAMVAMCNSVKYATLAAAVDGAAEDSTIILLADVALTETQTISKSLTLSLNGHNVTATDCRAFHVTAGTVAFTGTGTISTVVTQGTKLASSSSVIRVGSNTAETNFTLGENVTVTSDYCYGITYFGTQAQTVAINGTVAVTGAQAAISGNGTSTMAAVTLTVGGTVSATQDYAIYNPQTGTTAITGTVTGGIEVKAGTVTVAGTATVTARNVTPSHSSNQNGTSTQGYAIASVGNSSYKQPAKVSVAAGATVTGSVIILKENNSETYGEITSAANTLTIPAGYVWNGPADGVYTLAVASGFDGGDGSATFSIDSDAQAAIAAVLPSGKTLESEVLRDPADATSGTGMTYAQAYALGLLDLESGAVKDLKSSISFDADGKVVVSLADSPREDYTVTLKVYTKSSLSAEWPAEATAEYECGSETPIAKSGAAGFYKVEVVISGK